MKNCTNCGTSNTEDSKFCFSCGTPLPSQSQPAETTIPVDLAVSDPTAIPTPLIPPTSLPSTQKGIDNATNGISGKHVVAIAAGLLVVATAIGEGVSYATGMWGGHGEQSASTQREHHASAQKSGSASTHTKQQDNSNKAKNDGNVKDESKNAKKQQASEDIAQYHVTAQSYEFDLPKYWRDRVIAQVDGDTVTILSKTYPDTENPVCTISVESGTLTYSGGDVATSIMGYVPISSDHHVEVWAHRYPALAAMGGIELKSDEEYTDLTDLQSGGTVDFITARNNTDAGGESSDGAIFIIDDWMKNNLISAITVR